MASGEVGGEVSGEVISVKLDKSDYWIPVVPLGEPRVSFLSNGLIFRPKSSIIGRKEGPLDDRSYYEIV